MHWWPLVVGDDNIDDDGTPSFILFIQADIDLEMDYYIRKGYNRWDDLVE